jgi:ribosomal protein S18 acetylase RimI-like enzyme
MMHAALRPETPADGDFLRVLFDQVRAPELAGLEPAMLRGLLDMQFAAQQQSYRQAYPGARFEIVEMDGVAVGRQVVALTGGAVHLVDIALLAQWRGQGIGSALLCKLQQEAAGAGLPLRLHVALTNQSAEALYRRLGFKEIEVSGMHRAMEWENKND